MDARTLTRGTGGIVRLGGLVVGRLGDWEIVQSPTTGRPTLKGAGRFARIYGEYRGRLRVEATPAQAPAYIGRPKPPAPRPFVLEGVCAELTATTIIIGHGDYVRG